MATLVLLSCSKSSKEAKLEKSGSGVHVRIENAAGIILNEVSIGETSFGNVSMAAITNYQILSSPIYAPYCQVTVNANRQMAGYGVCGTPLPSGLGDVAIFRVT